MTRCLSRPTPILGGLLIACLTAPALAAEPSAFDPEFVGPLPEGVNARARPGTPWHALSTGLGARAPLQAAPADCPWRLDEALGTPDWLVVSGTFNARYEHIDGQWRANPALADDDQFILYRTELKAEVRTEPVGGAIEIFDGRQDLASDTTPLGTGEVNTVDVLQAYVDVALDRQADSSQTLRIGRQTLDLGSRRLVARNRFRNTRNTFTGVSWAHESEGGTNANVFWVMPVDRRPTDQAGLLDNDVEYDTQSRDRQFFGGFVSTPVAEHVRVEGYVFGLNETDLDTRRRTLYTPGVRVVRHPETQRVDYAFEAIYQFGDSRAVVGGPRLDHEAHYEHAAVGYTFDHETRPRVRLALDHASGDRRPGDGENNRFDPLYGVPRPDCGPTSLWRAVTLENILSPELRFECNPSEGTNLLLAARQIWLASDRDAWVASGGVRDATGKAGDEVGQQVELRYRVAVVPKSVQLEFGGAYLFAGDFLQDAPNSARSTDSKYGYAEISWSF